MARPQSVALGGYFPTPSTLLPRLAALVSFAPQEVSHVLADPCAGDGTAIAALRTLWFPEGKHEASIYAIELEQERAKPLRKKRSLPRAARSTMSRSTATP